MGRTASNRSIARALLRTIGRLEADPTVDQCEPVFIQLKCILLKRLLSLELDTAEAQSRIHLVESPRSEPAQLDEAECASTETLAAITPLGK